MVEHAAGGEVFHCCQRDFSKEFRAWYEGGANPVFAAVGESAEECNSVELVAVDDVDGQSKALGVAAGKFVSFAACDGFPNVMGRQAVLAGFGVDYDYLSAVINRGQVLSYAQSSKQECGCKGGKGFHGRFIILRDGVSSSDMAAVSAICEAPPDWMHHHRRQGLHLGSGPFPILQPTLIFLQIFPTSRIRIGRRPLRSPAVFQAFRAAS